MMRGREAIAVRICRPRVLHRGRRLQRSKPPLDGFGASFDAVRGFVYDFYVAAGSVSGTQHARADLVRTIPIKL